MRNRALHLPQGMLACIPVTAIVAPGGRAIENRPSNVCVSKDRLHKTEQKFLLPMKQGASSLAPCCGEAEGAI
jgi:hypothetical protein